MEFLPDFTSRIESSDGVATIALGGELDIASVPILEDQLASTEDDGVVAIMLDLRELTFLDCSALHALVAARRRASANGHRLILVGAQPRPRRLFTLTGTDFLLDQAETASVLEQLTGREGTEVVGEAVEFDD